MTHFIRQHTLLGLAAILAWTMAAAESASEDPREVPLIEYNTVVSCDGEREIEYAQIIIWQPCRGECRSHKSCRGMHPIDWCYAGWRPDRCGDHWEVYFAGADGRLTGMVWSAEYLDSVTQHDPEWDDMFVLPREQRRDLNH